MQMVNSSKNAISENPGRSIDMLMVCTLELLVFGDDLVDSPQALVSLKRSEKVSRFH